MSDYLQKVPKQLVISSQADYELSREFVTGLTLLLKQIDDHHKEIIEAAKSTLATAKRKHTEARQEVADRLTHYRDVQSRYLTEKKSAESAAIQNIQSEILASKQKVLTEQAEQLRSNGDHEQAALLEQIASENVSTLPDIQIVKDPGTQTRWTYDVVSLSEMNKKFLKISPNRKLIRAEVDKHGKQAEQLVGGIEVSQIVRPMYKQPKE